MIEHVIGIDPGLDGVGMAWLTRVAGEISVRDTRTVRSSPRMAMGDRLASIGALVGAVISEWSAADLIDPTIVRHVAIEVPVNPGRSDHAKKQGRENVNARSMMVFWQSLGVIRAAAHRSQVPVVDIPPGGKAKEQRQALFSRWTVAGKNADERDAIVIACVQLFSSSSLATIARASVRPS